MIILLFFFNENKSILIWVKILLLTIPTQILTVDRGGSPISCGLARPRSFAGGNPVKVMHGLNGGYTE